MINGHHHHHHWHSSFVSLANLNETPKREENTMFWMIAFGVGMALLT